MAKKSSLIEYEQYTEEDAERDAEEQKASRGGGFFKFPEGKTRLRFIPPPKAAAGTAKRRRWKEAVMEHFFEVPGVGNVKFPCVRFHSKGKRKCKGCIRERKLASTGAGADEQAARDVRAKRRCYTNAIIRSQQAEGPRIVPFGPMLEGELTDLRNAGYDFTNPGPAGYDVIVIKRVTRGRTTYKAVVAKEPSPLSDDAAQIREWIETAPDLTKFSVLPSDEEIDAKIAGDAPPSRDRGPARGSRRSIEDDLEDEDDEDDEDGEGIDEDDDDEVEF